MLFVLFPSNSGHKWGIEPQFLHSEIMAPSRRIEDRIRKLCEHATLAEGKQLEAIVAELQVTIHEYLRRMGNNMLAGVLKFPDVPEERRKP